VSQVFIQHLRLLRCDQWPGDCQRGYPLASTHSIVGLPIQCRRNGREFYCGDSAPDRAAQCETSRSTESPFYLRPPPRGCSPWWMVEGRWLQKERSFSHSTPAIIGQPFKQFTFTTIIPSVVVEGPGGRRCPHPRSSGPSIKAGVMSSMMQLVVRGAVQFMDGAPRSRVGRLSRNHKYPYFWFLLKGRVEWEHEDDDQPLTSLWTSS
jgi:hypothetical protein